MRPQDYCYLYAAPPTSANYYSLRRIHSTHREDVVAIHAFYREIENILLECTDQELALLKLNWWRSEVEKAALNQADHPVLRVLQQSSLRIERLFKIIDGFAENLQPVMFATFADAVVFWMKTAGERELYIADILGIDSVAPEIFYQAMLVLEGVSYLQHLRRYVQHHRVYFPLDELTQFQVPPTMLHNMQTTPEIKQLLQHQVKKISVSYQQLNHSLNPSTRRTFAYWSARCKIASVILQEIQASDFLVLENFIQLTPLRYWWLARK